jgi:hypothetical protein
MERWLMKLTETDIQDIKTVLNEQFDSIQKLKPLIHQGLPNDLHFMYEDILECNKVMMEIINGPSGTVERMV